MRKSIILLLTLTYFIESTGLCYALRPMAYSKATRPEDDYGFDEKVKLNEGAIDIIALDILSKHEKEKKTLCIGMDGDKHAFKSSFSETVARKLQRKLKVRLIHLDRYYIQDLWMDGHQVKEEGWDWQKLARDIHNAKESRKCDIVILEGFECFNICLESSIRMEEFDIKLHITADDLTREVIFRQEGANEKQAKEAVATIIQNYKGIRPHYEYVVDTSFEFWRDVSPVVLEIFMQEHSITSKKFTFTMLPDGIRLRDFSGAEEMPEWLKDKQLEEVYISVVELNEYLPLTPIISECKLDISNPNIVNLLDRLFDMPKKMTEEGDYYVVACEKEIFGLIRFDEKRMICDVMLLDPRDVVPGGPLSYWIKRQDRAMLVNPIETPKNLIGIMPITKGKQPVGMRLILEKAAEAKDVSAKNKKESAGLFTEEEMAGIRKRGEALKKIYPRLSKKAKKVLLKPDILAVFLGIKPAFIRYEKVNIIRLSREISKFPEISKSFGLLFTKNYIISFAHFLIRLNKEAGFLVNRDIVEAEDIIPLLAYDLNPQTAKIIGRVIVRLLKRYLKDIPGQSEFFGFLMGIPLEDVICMVEWENDPDKKDLPNIIYSQYGFKVVSKGGRETVRMLSRWDAALDYGYSLFACEPDFTDIIPAKALSVFATNLEKKYGYPGGQRATYNAIASSA